MNGNNQVRVFSELLAIDAWHKPLRYDGGTSSVHVDLSFHEGRIGGDDPAIPFVFRVRLKKATLSVKVEQPLKIDRDSVARSIPVATAEHKRIVSLKESAKMNANAGGKITTKSLMIAAGASASAGRDTLREEEVRFMQEIPRILATPKPKSAGEYAWELSASQADTMDGPPWNAKDEPRLSIKSLLIRQRIDPTIKIAVSCRLEDIVIDDLRLKDNGIMSAIKHVIFSPINEAAAIQQLKLTLRDANLEFGEMNDIFSEILIADVLASEL